MSFDLRLSDLFPNFQASSYKRLFEIKSQIQANYCLTTILIAVYKISNMFLSINF